MCLSPIRILARPKDSFSYPVTVSCGKCLECERQHSLEWAFRIMDECSKYECNAFVTLTYNNENLPEPPFVSRREVQLFMKRFRKEVAPLKVRFFACGEYGKKNQRPHYHAILFNWFPDDAFFWQKDGDIDLFRSPLLEKVWTKGFSSVGKVTEKSALYCAKYMNKYAYHQAPQAYSAFPEDPTCPFTDKITPPFVQMSNRPGIGFGSVYDCDLNTDRIYRNGKWIKIPRYYLKVMEQDGIYLDEFKERRRISGEMIAQCVDLEKKRDRFFEKFLEKKFVRTIDK